MSGIFGHLNLSDTDRVFSATVGQKVIFEAATAWINKHNEELNRLTSVFVSGNTEEFKLRYKLPGGGYLQRRSPDGRVAAVKATGQWDVSFPLEDFGAMLAWNDVDRAYMTVEELDRHIQTVTAQNVNTVRFELLTALLDNTNATFSDPLHGDLTIRRLANTDSSLYPPVIGSITEADDEHYLIQGAAYTSIDDDEDPWTDANTNSINIVSELAEHFGWAAGSDQIVSFINTQEIPYVTALTDFEPVDIVQIREGAQTASVVQVPPNLPGKVIGRHRGGAWIVHWDFIPALYVLSVHTGTEPPLKKRVDPADTGLGTDLQLVARDDEYPFESSIWRHRFGFGVANRLAACGTYIATGSTWSDPTLV